jgi:hypothetical protein
MKAPKRVVRPTLKRQAPVRTWSNLFGPSAQDNGAGKASAPSGPVDAVQRGVELAYRVSDEYFNQGRAFAQAMSQPIAPNSGARPGTQPELGQITERMLRYTSELSTMWMEALQMLSNGAGPLTGRPSPSPARANVPSSASAPRKVAIEIESRRRIKAAVDLQRAAGGRLTVGPLKITDGRAQLRHVDVSQQGPDGQVTVLIRVPAKQASGTYLGELLDSSTNTSVGTITVRVLA